MRHLWTRHRGPLLGLLSLVVPWFIFVRLAREVWEGEGLPGDRFLREFLHAHHGPVLDKAAFWLARLGGPMGATVLATAVALGVWWALHRRAAAFFGLAVVGAEILNLAAKYFVPRSRPLPWMDLDPQDTYRYALMVQDARLDMTRQGIYDKRGMRILKKIRCHVNPLDAECKTKSEE